MPQMYEFQKSGEVFVIGKTKEAKREEELKRKQQVLDKVGGETVEQLIAKVKELDERVARLEGKKVTLTDFRTTFEQYIEMPRR